MVSKSLLFLDNWLSNLLNIFTMNAVKFHSGLQGHPN